MCTYVCSLRFMYAFNCLEAHAMLYDTVPIA